MLEFTATSDGMSTIGEFRSGAFGDAPAIGSGIDLGGASLTVNLTDPTALEALILIDVDEIIGRCVFHDMWPPVPRACGQSFHDMWPHP